MRSAEVKRCILRLKSKTGKGIERVMIGRAREKKKRNSKLQDREVVREKEREKGGEAEEVKGKEEERQ